MWSLSDESLLAGLASADPESAAAFVRRFQARVFGLALTIVGDRETAQEVAQETFIRAWRYAAAYDSRRGRVATWLLRIARNVAIETAHLRRYEPIDPEVIVKLPIISSDVGPEERTVAIDESQRLRQAIAVLPEEQRRALVMAAFYGRTSREISEAEEIPLGTAKTRIRTAMLKLRSVLEVNDER
jgi:RNA polymerase sigma-70 factor (ECF subfamily)